MTASRVQVLRDAYFDSVLLLGAARAMRDHAAVTWATAVMATPANLAALRDAGFAAGQLGQAQASDLVLAVRADDPATADEALEAGQHSLLATQPGAQEGQHGARDPSAAQPRTLQEAVAQLPGADLAVISVPGDYAALEAHKALTAGLHVLLFSDNVPLAEEVELKDRAARLGLMVMGPGAGTAMLAGAALGFANVVHRGRVGVVAAAGTGAQEVMSLLDRWETGVSEVIGVGGRDLSVDVGGRMASRAVRALAADPGTDAILLVSKPPAARVARAVLAEAAGKPVVAALIGLGTPDELPAGIQLAASLEQAAELAAAASGGRVPDLSRGLRQQAAAAIERLAPGRTLVRGYYSGGTLCSEALLILSRHLGPVYSNIPLDPRHAVPAPPGRHTCLDLGEEEFTKGRPHPMIDPAARIEILRETARAPDVAVVLLDVVLGYGAHPDPAGQLAPVCRELQADGGPQVVAYVLGTAGDPQGYDRQRQALADAGCLVTPTGARAAHVAAAIAARQPDLAEATP